ncbi:MAG: 3-deoxy-manno-octulosonate cytidylyltransferase [Synergistaceae bacterium]|jgi:3-deoxy-manno-octulosonate cytidylyltransferase (CMP-KDO synthetase)|nr:3-deoxy-manno-octulosonate cytidylyltransferase [Synergistaceae bacterium]
MINALAVIPARYGSARLPGKPLLKLLDKELVLWVWEGAKKSASIDQVVVATDCEVIASLVEKAGGEAMMTPSELATGGDRVAFVAKRIPSRFVLNVQCDDPMISPGMIDPMVEALKKDPTINLAVLAKRIEDPDEAAQESTVKMVFDEKGRALYFSRLPVPFSNNVGIVRFKHIGPYAWRREALFDFASRSRTPLEKAESLEMLRVLETGGVIRCIETNFDTVEIDTPEDVEKFEKIFGL